MAQIEVELPKMGESVAEATITKWLKEVGDSIEAEESLVEIATDKVDSEVPSPESGVIKEIRFQEGDVVEVGKIIAIIASEGESTSTSAAVIPELVSPTETAQIEVPQEIEDTKTDFNQSGRFYSPLVKNIAQKENISLETLETIPGTGKEGRLTKNDLLSYIGNSKKTAENVQVSSKAQEKTKAQVVQTNDAKPKVQHGENVEIIEMDRMRKLIADHMVMSKQTSPHVTSFVEADVTNLVLWRNKIKNKFAEREGTKITFTPLFVEAVVRALKDYPMVNVSVDGNQIIRKKNINVGIATALPSGNLIVPVIKNADSMNLVGLAKSTNELVDKARNNKLSPDEIQGGTFTLTNVGTFGNLMGTPIINQPQVAILATGAIKKKPAVIETEFGDVIAIRHMMYLSHSYDHRVVDGALGGSFLRRVADYLEQFDINRVIN
jgi:2-oxoglutarate dehydrogenase E2 component (dihydrolipoamide succinyltransferase)